MLVQSMAPSAAEIALAPTATCTIVGADGRVRSSSGGAGSGGAVAGSRLITEPAPYAGAPYGGASDLGSESDVPVDSLSEDTGDEFRDDIERGAQAPYSSLPPTRYLPCCDQRRRPQEPNSGTKKGSRIKYLLGPQI